MALVMLPCDLPWWPTIVRHLTQISEATNVEELIQPMKSIHNLCNVGLDPDEPDLPDPNVFNGLEQFLTDVLDEDERSNFFAETLPCMARRALDLKRLRPPNGLHFSLQQQVDRVEFERDFVASLLANSFFSTFPKRTAKTHPTLQDFNFSYFFRHLDLKYQQYKLLSILYYFNYLERFTNHDRKIVLARQVMNSSQWLTIEDWLSCKLPLCPLLIRRKGDIQSVGSDHIIVCSARSKIGGTVLSDGVSMECIRLVTCPEMLVILLCVEALEDNEVLLIEGVLQVTKVYHPKGKVSLEKLQNPHTLTVCCMDPEDYAEVPLLQLQQDSVLRELNKALLGFRQKPPPSGLIPRRLSPIGESFSSTPEKDLVVAKKTETRPIEHLQVNRRFIVLGSSGECLPITRNISQYSSCQSTSSYDRDSHSNISPDRDEDFHSARTSFTDEDVDDTLSRRVTGENDERRSAFADRLQEALNRAEEATTDSDQMSDLRYKRDGSCGFVLDGESQTKLSFCENFQRIRAASSKYSFTTDYSSELDCIYEQLGRWLDEDCPVPQDVDLKELREKAVIQFAGNLLKRTLSESFVGVSVTDGVQEEIPVKNIKVAARSLSLELARHRNKLTAQLASVVMNRNDDILPIATYNWGCSSRCGEPQLKLMIQWLAASVALLPHILYFTAENSELNKLDTVCRVLLDRQWSVGELISAVLKYCEMTIFNPENQDPLDLFEQIIGIDEKMFYLDESSPDE
ncbi:Poly (ADP-ribose) glycohydrolase (PARG) [Nesidiocoris tenuis]|uniref:poly(ADP-ribose) glycohydrolase n=1 Tax=Nesidiocoris tenuis TaxID=355587 RepID=A0ABN7AU99_9HEMI|nr:Poly (ADP-ribose) glycohydrolase (PARG) [Nesidiocoris tenuis]